MSRRNGIEQRLVVTPCKKLYVCGLRLHHGLTGEVLAFAGLALVFLLDTEAGVIAAVIGAVLVIHDWHDFPFRLIDRPGDGPHTIQTPGEHHGISR